MGVIFKAKQLGLVDPKWEITPASGAWDGVRNKAFETRCMEVYAAMIDCMDQGIGRVLDAVRKLGAESNTLVLFLSDNGASAEVMVRGDGHDPSAPPGSAKTFLAVSARNTLAPHWES